MSTEHASLYYYNVREFFSPVYIILHILSPPPPCNLSTLAQLKWSALPWPLLISFVVYLILPQIERGDKYSFRLCLTPLSFSIATVPSPPPSCLQFPLCLYQTPNAHTFLNFKHASVCVAWQRPLAKDTCFMTKDEPLLHSSGLTCVADLGG